MSSISSLDLGQREKIALLLPGVGGRSRIFLGYPKFEPIIGDVSYFEWLAFPRYFELESILSSVCYLEWLGWLRSVGYVSLLEFSD